MRCGTEAGTCGEGPKPGLPPKSWYCQTTGCGCTHTILAATLASADHTLEHPVMPQHHTLSCAGSPELSEIELTHDIVRMVAVTDDFEATMQSLLQKHVYSYHFPQHRKSKLSIHLHEPPFTLLCCPSTVILQYILIIYHKSCVSSQTQLSPQSFRDPGTDSSVSSRDSSCYMWLLLLYGTARTIVKPYRAPVSANYDSTTVLMLTVVWA